MTIIELFQTVNDYWINAYVPRARALGVSMTDQELAVLAQEIIDVTKDRTVGGHEFTCINTIAEENDKPCVKGTILDVYTSSSGSIIRVYFKRVSTYSKVLLHLATGKGTGVYKKLCSNFLGIDRIPSKGECIDGLKDIATEVFDEGGVFDQIIGLANEEKWKIDI